MHIGALSLPLVSLDISLDYAKRVAVTLVSRKLHRAEKATRTS